MAQSAFDKLAQAETALEAANAALAAWAPTTRRYRINGREMEFNGAAEIMAIIGHWKAAVRSAQAEIARQDGLPNPRKVLVSLGRA